MHYFVTPSFVSRVPTIIPMKASGITQSVVALEGGAAALEVGAAGKESCLLSK